jgi:hypothetical protein
MGVDGLYQLRKLGWLAGEIYLGTHPGLTGSCELRAATLAYQNGNGNHHGQLLQDLLPQKVL